ncbi:MAG: hypothetical protein H6937_07155 [Burkholderiales bacterium]|nr:hypothetical protein [Burkholderiales bacterium]
MSVLSDDFVHILNVAVYPTAAFCAMILPLARAYLRYRKHIKPVHKRTHLIQDISHGLAFPFFLLMILSPLHSGIVIEKHIIFLAGIYGIRTIIKDLLDNQADC